VEITENCEGFGVRPKRKLLYFEFIKDAKENEMKALAYLSKLKGGISNG